MHTYINKSVAILFEAQAHNFITDDRSIIFYSKCRRANRLGVQSGQLFETLYRHGGASIGLPLATNRWLQRLTPWRRWGERSRAKQHSTTDENHSKEKAEIHAKFDESGWR